NKCRKRNRFGSAEGRIPTGSVFARRDLFAVVVHCFARWNNANELLAGLWVLTGDEPLILFARYFAGQTPLFRQLAYPITVYFTSLAVVVLLLVVVVLLVIGVGLACGKRITHRHHGCSPQKPTSRPSITSEVISAVCLWLPLPLPFPFASAV